MEQLIGKTVKSRLEGDSSFKQRFIPGNSSKRRAYESGYKIGFMEGVHWQSPECQQQRFSEWVMINGTPEQKGFYSEFLKLCSKYNTGITYDPGYGLRFYELNKKR